MEVFFTTYKDTFASVAALIGLAAFINGLWQYRKAQKWKRMEFIASEAKLFSENEAVRDVLAMLDYRRKKFAPNGKRGVVIVVLHENAKDYVSQKNEVVVMLADALRFNNFNAVADEVRFIREKFDDYFTLMDRFSIFIEAKLLSFSEVEPYLRYHFDLLNGKIPHSQGYHEEMYQYLVMYNFDWVLNLLSRNARPEKIIGYESRAKKLREQLID